MWLDEAVERNEKQAKEHVFHNFIFLSSPVTVVCCLCISGTVYNALAKGISLQSDDGILS